MVDEEQMIKVEILFDEQTGAVNINGPIDNRELKNYDKP
jgi:hypothetical protein